MSMEFTTLVLWAWVGGNNEFNWAT